MDEQPSRFDFTLMGDTVHGDADLIRHGPPLGVRLGPAGNCTLFFGEVSAPGMGQWVRIGNDPPICSRTGFSTGSVWREGGQEPSAQVFAKDEQFVSNVLVNFDHLNEEGR